MMNIFNELIVSRASAKDQLIQWKHEAEVSIIILKTFKGSSIYYSQNCLLFVIMKRRTR